MLRRFTIYLPPRPEIASKAVAAALSAAGALPDH